MRRDSVRVSLFLTNTFIQTPHYGLSSSQLRLYFISDIQTTIAKMTAAFLPYCHSNHSSNPNTASQSPLPTLASNPITSIYNHLPALPEAPEALNTTENNYNSSVVPNFPTPSASVPISINHQGRSTGSASIPISTRHQMPLFSHSPNSRLPPPLPHSASYQIPVTSSQILSSPLSLHLPMQSSIPQSSLIPPPTTHAIDSWIACNSPVTPHFPPTPVDPAPRSAPEIPPQTSFQSPIQPSPHRQTAVSLPPPLHTSSVYSRRYLSSSAHLGFSDVISDSVADNPTDSQRLLLSAPLEETLTPSPQPPKNEPDLCLFSDFQSSISQRASFDYPLPDTLNCRPSMIGSLPSGPLVNQTIPAQNCSSNAASSNLPSSTMAPISTAILHGSGIPSGDLSKPINTLGGLCFAGFYLVTLTRTLVRNRTVPHAVRRTFMAPQLHFGFTIRDKRDGKWRHIHTVQIPYGTLTSAGEWLRARLEIDAENVTFKAVKDSLQKAVASAWADGTWGKLVDRLATDFGPSVESQVDAALDCDAVASRTSGTPRQYFNQLNCHKGAQDIRRDVDGAISAREALKYTLSQLGLNLSGSNIPIGKFRDEVFPLWEYHCSYVREHGFPNCCTFYGGGYFKKIMIHKHLYNMDGCTSSYHVKDLFEGLDEVTKAWSNPTGMCVREAKCAAGLRYNVDKSFQSGIRSYAKAKFLEAAPHTAREFISLERELRQRVLHVTESKLKKLPVCRRALRDIETKSEITEHRMPPDVLLSSNISGVLLNGNAPSERTILSPTDMGAAQGLWPSLRKRRRHDTDLDRDSDVERTQERERDRDRDHERELMLGAIATPREQKRKHAHLSLKRKEAAEIQVRNYLELLRADCQRQEELLDRAKRHGEGCHCSDRLPDEFSTGLRHLS